MSTTPQNYELIDYEAIAAVFDSLSFAEMRAVVGDGWQGFVEDNAPFEPKTRSAPTLFAQWAIEYSKVETNLDPESPPFRVGIVTLYVRLQPGARRGLLLLAVQKIREAFRAAQTPLQFEPATAMKRQGLQDGFWTEQLDIHFHGA